MNLSKFVEHLSDLMFEAKISAQMLPEKIGCGKNTVYRYLQGERIPSVTLIVALADYFHCSTDFLIGLEEENYPQTFVKCPPFNERFPFLLQHFKITQYKLEKETGISHSAMVYWKNNKKQPTIESVVKIAKVFNCSVDFVLGRTKD